MQTTEARKLEWIHVTPDRWEYQKTSHGCEPAAVAERVEGGWVPKIVSGGEEIAIGDAKSLAEAKQGAGTWAILIVTGEILGDA
jgi:hypothetical protein